MHRILTTPKTFEEAYYSKEPTFYYYNNRQGNGCMRSKRWRWHILAQRNIPTREETKRINGFAYFEQNLQNGKKQYRLQSRISLNTPHAGICYKVDEHFLEWLLGTPIKEPAQAFIDRVRGRKYNSGQKYYSIDWITKYLMRVQPKKKKADR